MCCLVELRMLTSKLVALCVCPALLAPPVVLAVHKPARHAVARILHRAANRLDHGPAVHSAPVAAVPCQPTFGEAGGGLPGSDQLGGDVPIGFGSPSDAGGTATGFGYSSSLSSQGSGYATASGGGGLGAGLGSNSASSPGSSNGSNPGSVALLPPGSSLQPSLPGEIDVPVSGVPEPESWALMIVGFGLVGSAVRWRTISHLKKRASLSTTAIGGRV